MSGFNFRLQRVLDIRIEKEEQSKMEFKIAQEEKNLVQHKLENLKENYSKYSRSDLNCSTVEMRIRQNYCNVLQFNINKTSKELNIKNKALENKREALKERQIERKTVEILKENQRLAYIKEQNQIEQKANDEFALYGYIRKLKSK